jgi:catechol 2,3-dioxygenase-like lactoylglutathione lyase family enzyme
MRITTTRIGQIQLIMIPSTDQDRSVAFYEALGFEKRADFPWRDSYRWIELYPKTGTAGLALVPPQAGDPTGVQTGIILHADDIDAAHAELRAGGVDVDAGVAREGAPTSIRLGAIEMVGPVPPMFWFRDPDGNRLLIVEPTR